MTAEPLQRLFCLFTFMVAIFFDVATNAWSPAHTDDQLDIINNALEKWKSQSKYPAVKDIFKEESYKPDWNVLKEDAGIWDLVPESFSSEREALRAGCKCDFIKNPTNKTCLLKLVEGQGAWIFVYDRDPAAKYVKSGVIVPPTWYGDASVALVDIFGTGKPKFILIEHRGNHGTGVDEKIHWLIGWHDGAFRTALRETVLSDIGGPGVHRIYRMNYSIAKGKEPRIESRHSYDEVDVSAQPYDFHSSWKDWLFWNEKTFSFYDARIQTEKIRLVSGSDNEFPLRQQIERNRKKILKLPLFPQGKSAADDSDEYWKEIDPR